MANPLSSWIAYTLYYKCPCHVIHLPSLPFLFSPSQSRLIARRKTHLGKLLKVCRGKRGKNCKNYNQTKWYFANDRKGETILRFAIKANHFMACTGYRSNTHTSCDKNSRQHEWLAVGKKDWIVHKMHRMRAVMNDENKSLQSRARSLSLSLTLNCILSAISRFYLSFWTARPCAIRVLYDSTYCAISDVTWTALLIWQNRYISFRLFVSFIWNGNWNEIQKFSVTIIHCLCLWFITTLHQHIIAIYLQKIA